MPEHISENIVIERAVPEDAPHLAAVQAQSWLDTYIKTGKDERNNEISDLARAMEIPERIEARIALILQADANPEGELYLTARFDNEVTGLLYGTKTSDKQEIQVLYVAREAKRRGIGRALINRFLEWSDATRPVELGVIDDNEDAQEFYKRMGFRLVEDSARPFYENSHLTEVTMIRKGDES